MPGRNREKDQSMAAHLKAAGDERTKARCPICHVVVSLSTLYNHICHTCQKHGGVKDGTEAT